MVLKFASSNETHRNITNTELMFNNEHIMYTEVLPKLVQLQKAAGVPGKDQLRYAKCYGSLNEAPNELIILEDLNESGFTMLNKFESLSNECVKSILQNFSVLHSLSYVLKHKEPETYDHIKDKLMDPWKSSYGKPEVKMRIQIVKNETMSVVEDNDYKHLLENKFTDIFDLRSQLMEFEKNNKYSVIQQGDAWTNNIMFKVGFDPVQSILIDYQTSFNSNPVIDLLFMVFNCTDYEIRSKNYYDWIDYYHSELDKSLSNFDLRANFVYPREQLDADIIRYAELIFGQSLALANMLMRNPEETAELVEAFRDLELNEIPESMKTGNLHSQSQARIKKRIIGLIDSFKDFGLL